jgi:hypothetical protein
MLMKTNESDTHTMLNDLLVEWHRWCNRYQHVKGYASSDPTCRDYRASRQYDDTNGALDADLSASTLETVSAEIFALEQPYQTAIQIQARNMATGKQVWTSPRLPADPMERAGILVKARGMLLKTLASRGVLV